MTDGQDNAQFDAFTAMPLELDDQEYQPLGAAYAPAAGAGTDAGKRNGRFDIQGLFWKFVASGTPDTPAEVLACLAADERPAVRRRVAVNASTSPETLAELACDTAPSVRAAVARNPRTPVFVLRKLSQDDDVSVRYAIAANEEMPDAILLSLFMDPDPYVAERASHTLAA